MQLDPGTPPGLVPLAWLLDTWQGVGVGGSPGGGEFRFGQEVAVAHAFDAASAAGQARHWDGAPPYLTYRSRTWLLDDAGEQVRPLVEETGYWRPGQVPAGGGPVPLELLLVHPAGYLELWAGTATGPRIDLTTDVVARSPLARDYTAGTRMYGLVQGDLLWVMDMAAAGEPLASHVSARLRRA